jgi:hypothetical protein
MEVPLVEEADDCSGRCLAIVDIALKNKGECIVIPGTSE